MKHDPQKPRATMDDATRLYMAYGLPLDQAAMRADVDRANSTDGLDGLRQILHARQRNQ